MAKPMSNNKLRNTGILYEAILCQLVAETHTGVDHGAAKLIRKYFNPTTELSKELKLYTAIAESRSVSEAQAIQLVDVILRQRKKIKERSLLKEKYNLINDIKESYNLKEFLSTKISNYRLYGSVYKLFMLESDSSDEYAFNDIVALRYQLIEHMTSSPPEKKTDNVLDKVLKEDVYVRDLTYKFVIDKFNKKYEGLLESQKAILKEYMFTFNNPLVFGKFFVNAVKDLRTQLETRRNIVTDDALKVKLGEVINKLVVLEGIKRAKSTDVVGLMIAHELLQQLDTLS